MKPYYLTEKGRSVAVVCARGIGDALTWMVMAYQISRCGHSVVLYSDVLYEMQQWFPEVLIRKQAHSAEEFSEYDHILADDHSWFVRKIAGSKSTKRILIPKESEFDRSKQRIFNMQWVLAQFYGINTSDRNNGLRPLGDAVKGRFSKRIAIHPTASDRRRYWGAKKFLELSKRLQKLGYEVGFVMSPEEREEWRREVAVSADLPRFENLSEVARYIYESAYFIGSDSGLGHLASNLGTPTVSIFVRKSHSRNWRPGWSDGVVVSPFNILPTRYLRQRIWRPLVTVGRVLNGFKKLVGQQA